jgi:hypothetical protein
VKSQIYNSLSSHGTALRDDNLVIGVSDNSYMHILYIYVFVYLHMCICVDVYICICTCVYIHTCIYAYIYTYIYIHMYMYTNCQENSAVVDLFRPAGSADKPVSVIAQVCVMIMLDLLRCLTTFSHSF